MRASTHLQVVFMSGLSEVVLCLCLCALVSFVGALLPVSFSESQEMKETGADCAVHTKIPNF
jgi:hypothetical protein